MVSNVYNYVLRLIDVLNVCTVMWVRISRDSGMSKLTV